MRQRIPAILADADNGLSHYFRELLHQGYQKFCELGKHIAHYDTQLQRLTKQSEACQRLQSLPGYGPVVASAYLSEVGDGSSFAKGRDVSAALGLVPHQHSGGDKAMLLDISKRGNKYLRTLLIHGARSIVRQVHDEDDALSQWINRIRERHGFNKASVAFANKMARMGWAILSNNGVYRPRQASTG